MLVLAFFGAFELKIFMKVFLRVFDWFHSQDSPFFLLEYL